MAARPIAFAVAVLAFSCGLLAQESGLNVSSEAAHQAMIDGHYDVAARLYRKLVDQLPQDAGLRLNLGLALEQAGRPADAIPHLEKATRVQPESGAAWFLLGLGYQQLNQPQRAIAPLREAVRLDTNNYDALFELADAELTSADYSNAARSFQTLTDARPEMAKAWQGASVSYNRLSEELAARVQRSAPQSGYAKALAARSQAEKQRFGTALRLYRQALDAAPVMAGIHAACARIYRQTGHPEWAATEDARERKVVFRHCTEKSPACDYRKKNYRAVLDSQGGNAETLYWQSLAAAQMAEKSLRNLSQLPSAPAQHEVLADAYQRKGQRLEAVSEWRRALALAPGDHRLQGRLAESLYRARIYPEAEQRLRRLVAAEPGNSEWQYLLGSVLLEEEHPEDATVPLEKALRLQPGLLPAEENLGRAYLNSGRAADAIRHLEKALPLDDGSLSFALSTAYRKAGRLDDARAALERYRQFSKLPAVSANAPEDAVTPP